MKKPLLLCNVLLIAGALSTSAQVVSNDNEDGVYKIDGRAGANDFVPGQVLVKFKDESTIKVRSNERGKFRAASINAVDRLLRSYGVDEMEKLYPSEVAKPKSQLRKRKAPNGTVVQEKNLDKVYWVKTKVQSSDSTLQLIEQLQSMPEVEYAEPNYRVYITADVPTDGSDVRQRQPKDIRLAPVRTETDASVICAHPENNPLYSQQYGITQQNIHTLWDKPIINNKRPVIAILDTGIDLTHPDLQDNIWQNTKEVTGEKAFDDDGNGIVDDKYGWNFVEDYYDLTDYNGHGTHVAGIAAASDNSVGVVGANPLALIMPLKVINDKGNGDIATVCRGIHYAAENGADIINMSFGHTGEAMALTEIEAITQAYQTCILVASAGNNGASVYDTKPNKGPLWPAAYYLVLGVQASDSNGQLAGFSNYDPDGPIFSEDGVNGRNHEIMVAGVGIYSTYLNGNYKALSGTSMSAPLFAGAVSALQMVKEYPSKDVLFGDLIHLNADFAQIYSDDTPRYPDIGVVAMLVDDSANGNGDGQVDAGEVVDFSVVLRNTWADATDIRLKLAADDEYWEFVNIKNPNVDFGYSMSAYGRETSQTPINVKFANNIGDNTRIKFTMEIICAESNRTIRQDIYVTVHNMIKLGGILSSDMTLAAGKKYFVSSSLAIPEGVTLTIEPGTTIEFAEGTTLSSSGKIQACGTPQKPIRFIGHNGAKWTGISAKRDTLRYCQLEDLHVIPGSGLYLKDCIVRFSFKSTVQLDVSLDNCLYGERINFINHMGPIELKPRNVVYSNIVNNECLKDGGGGLIKTSGDLSFLPSYSSIQYCNYFNNFTHKTDNGLTGVPFYEYFNCEPYSIRCIAGSPYIERSEKPSYLGTARESVIRPLIYEMGPGHNDTFGQVDLSNMPSRPYAEAHGIVWKVVVDGYDAQDEFDELAPLGVGRHKFEVYFNRPMNKDKAPQISYGVREPFTQHSVNEDGSWNEEGTIYTVYHTITGRTMTDGLNRIYVDGAEDNEYFPIPYEKTRFNINIQAAGSMATGFMAEAGMGKVDLTWNNDENDFEDAMGFNIYRYTMDDAGNADTVRVNQEIVDIATTAYTDYDVVPGNTYYYMYKVLSTDLEEYDMSNVVAVTPLTSTLGDANGSGDVDVADVITTVNYAAGQQPKPFIYEAADMNADLNIDILDVIGIIKKIMNPDADVNSLALATATYTVEDGTLYVESPVELAGVQVQIAMSNSQTAKENEGIKVAADLNGFEHTSAWLSDNDYLFLAYNMNGKTLTAGKHALLHIGDAKIAAIRFSDANGHNVEALGNEVTRVNRMATDVLTVRGIYDMQGRKLTGDFNKEVQLPKGVYIINGKKVVR
ncbi:MAG: S8 family serine peptidase [Bacteroidaceae bacterium]|nr:S8 family serine peptidase [Bacteroidaceae bacterium]